MFNKRAILLSCFLILSLNYYSQSYFNNRYDIISKTNTSGSFINFNDTFYIPTTVHETESPNTYSACLLKINPNGTIYSAKRFKPNNYNYSNGNQIFVKNNKFYIAGLNDYGLQLQSALYVFNENCDTLITRGVGDTAFYNFTYKILPYIKTKNKLLLIGVTDSACGSGHQGLYKPVIRVVDTNGVLYQTKIYLSDCKYRNINSVDTTENKGYLIGFGGSYGTWDTEARILKLDSNLNVIWDKQINIISAGACNVINHQNKFYTVLSTHVDSVWNFNYDWERVCLTRLALNGSVIWQKYYGVKERPMLTSGLKKCANGDYIMCGTRRTSPSELQGWIMRTDSLGNQKWWKEYRPFTTPILDTLAENYLYDIMELPNGDIAAVGWAGQSSISPLQQTWLLKVDSNGCFGIGNCPPNLTTGINEVSNTNEISLKVFPNPFTNHITVSYKLQYTNKPNVEINLINMVTGQIITKQTSTKNEDIIDFNTENLANGVYIINISNHNVSISNTKIINIK